MPVHTRLFCRGAAYYHCAVLPQDMADTNGKAEETFSLRTRDEAEAVRRVRVATLEVDRKFDDCRLRLAHRQGPMLRVLTPDRSVANPMI
ncbi:DUF6538 domain-containing protein [Rhodovulum steppense]